MYLKTPSEDEVGELLADHQRGGCEFVAVVDDRGGPGASLAQGLAVPEAVVVRRGVDRAGVEPVDHAVVLPHDLHIEGDGHLARHLETPGDHN